MKLQNRTVLGVMGFSFFSLAGRLLNAQAIPPTTDDVLAQLKAADQAVAQGRVVYDVERRRNPLPLTEEKIKALVEEEKNRMRDQGSNKDDLTAHTARFKEVLQAGNRSSHYAERQTLVYTKDKRFLEKSEPLGKGGEPEVISAYTGKDYLVSYKGVEDGRQVSLRQDRPEILKALSNPAQYLGALAPGPCFINGRGLSALDNLRYYKKGKDLIVEGNKEGAFIHAVVDPKRGYILKLIERRDLKGKLFDRWIFTHPHRTKSGVWLPSASNLITYLGESHSNQDKHKLIYAGFEKPDESALLIPLDGKRIIDDRFGKPVSYKDGFPQGVRNLDKLFIYTRKTLEAESVAKNRLDEAYSQEKGKRLVVQVSLSGLLLVSLGAFTWGMRRKFNYGRA